MDRIRSTISKVPFAVVSVSCACICLFLIGLIPSFDIINAVCLNTAKIVPGCKTVLFYFIQVHRLWIYAYVHSGVLHLLFNVYSFIGVGRHFEKQEGTYQFFGWISTIIYTNALLHVLISFIINLFAVSSNNILFTPELSKWSMCCRAVWRRICTCDDKLLYCLYNAVRLNYCHLLETSVCFSQIIPFFSSIFITASIHKRFIHWSCMWNYKWHCAYDSQ